MRGTDALVVKGCRRLEGRIRLPGDKSVSHRAIILSSLARGTSCVRGVQRGKDCFSTLKCMRALGVSIKEDKGNLIVEGKGFEGLKEPDDVLNCENSGTTMRILSGVLTGRHFYSVLTGDRSLRGRPMRRIIEPLGKMGAKIWAREGGYPPLSIKGGKLQGMTYTLPVASAQVKTSILLAGLAAQGTTVVVEPSPSRNHTEKMLDYMGARINVENQRIEVTGPQQLEAREVTVPGDISAAAFFIGGASILEGSCVEFDNVGVNPTRSAFLEVLEMMGAQIEKTNERIECGEEIVTHLRVWGRAHLKGMQVDKSLVPRLIDEIPIIAVVACFAEGETRIEGAEELRVKETDRIRALRTELSKMGAWIEERKDGMIIKGKGELEGAEVDGWGDHRITMALAIAGVCARGETRINNSSCVEISFPEFQDILSRVAV